VSDNLYVYTELVQRNNENSTAMLPGGVTEEEVNEANIGAVYYF
jgi:hypothetical protein